MKFFFGITLGIFVVLLLFWGVYNLGFKENPSVATVSEGTKIIKESVFNTPWKPAEKVSALLTERIASATAYNRFLYFYSLDEKAFRRSTLDGKEKETLLSNLPGEPTRIVWAPNHEKALVLLKKSDGSSLWHTLDFSTQTLIPLKPEISRIAWDNTGSKIFYQYTDPKTGDRTLNSADPDGKNWKNIIALGSKDFFIAPVPGSISVSYWNRPSAREKGALSVVPLTGGSTKTLVHDVFGGDFLWAPSGNRVLMQATDNADPSKIRLALMNESGGELQTLEMAQTLITKAVWSKSGKILYYALPSPFPESSTLPNDYFEKNLHSQDSFWKLDVETKKAERLIDLKDITEAYDATELFLAPDEHSLYFTDRTSQKLFRIEF
jgi:Tol biopolymer transport system component